MDAPQPRATLKETVRQHYQFPSRQALIVNEVGAVVRTFPSLRPKLDNFVSDDGESATLLVLSGTLPISFRGAQYHIPIDVFIPQLYNDEPIIAYVRPTVGMKVREDHQYVDKSGKCSLPNIRTNPSYESTMIAHICALQSVFSASPPCYSVPNGTTQEANMAAGSHGKDGALMTNFEQRSLSPPPSYGNKQTTNAMTQNSSSSVMDDREGHRDSQFNSNRPLSMSTDPEIIERLSPRERLLHRIKCALQVHMDEVGYSITHGMRTQAQISNGADRIETIKNALRSEHKRIQENGLVLQSRISELKEWLRHEEEYRNNIDERLPETMLNLPNAREEKLLELIVEDAALEDCLRALSDALEKDALEVSVYLKEVRRIGRQQFMARALRRKILSAVAL